MATAAPTVTDAPAPAKGKKKLIIIIAAAVLVLAGGGGAAMVLLKKKPAAEGEDGEPVAQAVAHDPKAVPVFVPLDPFTVNLADREAERYAQVGMTLELTDQKSGDLLKAYMPAIRNNILLVLAGKTAAELMDHEGKLLLAAQVRAAALKPLGYEVPDPAAAASAPKLRKPVDDGDEPPVRAVHFSNFIIQ